MARMLMKKQQNNYAFIDGANLYMWIASLGWELEYPRFRTWLTEAVLVSSDGDYACLVSFLKERGVFKAKQYREANYKRKSPQRRRNSTRVFFIL